MNLFVKNFVSNEVVQLLCYFLLNAVSCLNQLIEKARDYLGLSELEKHSQDGGGLEVQIGDVLAPSENVSGKYAGENFL